MALFYLSLSLLFFPSCQPTNDNQPDMPETPITYLALGDSYTIGQSVPEPDRYPEQLAAALRTEGFDVAEPVIIAQTGWRTDNLQTAIDDADLAESYDLVSLLIGVNNQYQGRPLNEYRQEFTQLLERAIALAGGEAGRVFVLSIPDYAYTPFGQLAANPAAISTGIDAFNAANREITEAYGVAWFDITPISRRGLAEPELIASDGLHPSGEQYARWVEVVLEGVKALISP